MNYIKEFAGFGSLKAKEISYAEFHVIYGDESRIANFSYSNRNRIFNIMNEYKGEYEVNLESGYVHRLIFKLRKNRVNVVGYKDHFIEIKSMKDEWFLVRYTCMFYRNPAAIVKDPSRYYSKDGFEKSQERYFLCDQFDELEEYLDNFDLRKYTETNYEIH